MKKITQILFVVLSAIFLVGCASREIKRQMVYDPAVMSIEAKSGFPRGSFGTGLCLSWVAAEKLSANDVSTVTARNIEVPNMGISFSAAITQTYRLHNRSGQVVRLDIDDGENRFTVFLTRDGYFGRNVRVSRDVDVAIRATYYNPDGSIAEALALSQIYLRHEDALHYNSPPRKVSVDKDVPPLNGSRNQNVRGQSVSSSSPQWKWDGEKWVLR